MLTPDVFMKCGVRKPILAQGTMPFDFGISFFQDRTLILILINKDSVERASISLNYSDIKQGKLMPVKGHQFALFGL